MQQQIVFINWYGPQRVHVSSTVRHYKLFQILTIWSILHLMHWAPNPPYDQFHGIMYVSVQATQIISWPGQSMRCIQFAWNKKYLEWLDNGWC